MKNPLVSVIIDNYNYDQYIEEAILSVLNQTYKNYELIIVDDGSTDNSRNIISKYEKQDSRIKAIYKKNGGQTSAINEGFRKSKGEIIAFLDSDDCFYKEKLEYIVKEHESHDFVTHLWTRDNKEPAFRKNEETDWRKVLMNFGVVCDRYTMSNLSFSRKLISRFMPLKQEEKIRYCTDFVLLACCLHEANLYVIDKILCYYRQHNNSFVGKLKSVEDTEKAINKNYIYANIQMDSMGFARLENSIQKYYREIVRDLKKLEKPLCLYGLGLKGTFLLKALEEEGVGIYGIINSKVNGRKEKFYGYTIYSPHEIIKERNEFSKIIISSVNYEYEIEKQLIDLGLEINKDYLILPL